MSVTLTPPALAGPPSPPSPPSPPGPTGPRARNRLGLIVIASIATGLVGALVLTLVVFAGAPEHVITGSALLAFAGGWAMLGALSTGQAAQPQRWAFVPAGAMAAVGAALLVFAPGDQAMQTLGWVWPIPLVALAAWIARTSRQHLHSRVRAWVLYPVAAFLAVAGLGGGYETIRLALDERAYAMPGQLYDVGGHRLHIDCRGGDVGGAGPTVVLLNGLGGTSANWFWVTHRVAAHARVCAYDRAGQGWSDDGDGPPDGAAVATDLHRLLAASGEPGPYVLVGHSTGGVYAMTYAAQYPDEVAGMVLLDATSPDAFAVLPDYPSAFSMMRQMYGVAPSLARIGVGQLVGASAGQSMPASVRGPVRAFATSPRMSRSQRDELAGLRDAFDQARALEDMHGKPLAVVTASEGQQAGWSTAQDRLAVLSTNRVHRVATASHTSLLSDATDAALSAQAVADVVSAVKTGVPLGLL